MNYTEGNYWKMDRVRAFKSWKYGASIVGVFLIFVFCGSNMYYPKMGLVDIIDNIFWGRMVMLTIPMCALVYSDAICADCEKKFYRLFYTRGDKKRYLTSKIGTCFGAACGAMTIGFLLFCFVLSFKYPVMVSGGDYSYTYAQSYGYLLEIKQYFAYFFLVGFQYGLLAGILATVGMTATIFLVNRLLAYAVPLFFYYFLINLFSDVGSKRPYLQLHLIFKACHSKPWENDIFCLGWAILVTILSLSFIGKIAKWGMNRRVMND